MWRDYGANHTGFCVGYNLKIPALFNKGGGDVRYYDKLPIIIPSPIHDKLHTMKQFHDQYFSKLKQWEFEEEYRLLKRFPEPATAAHRTITLPDEALLEIIFGAKIDPKHKKEIMEFANEHLPKVKLLQAHLTDNEQIEITSA